jgi:uncharacterized protein YkwD
MKRALLISLVAVAVGAKSLVHISPPKLSKAKINEYLRIINSARAQTQDCGIYGVKSPAKPLRWNYNLYKAAYEHSRDMAMNDFLEHYGSNTKYDLTGKIYGTSDQFKRSRANGYKHNDYVGENILYGNYHFRPQRVVDLFIEHDEHCPNMMNKRFKDVGVAYYYNPQTGNEYWTIVLGVHYVKRYKY